MKVLLLMKSLISRRLGYWGDDYPVRINHRAMKTLSQIQEQINSLYVSHFKNYSGGLGLSVPLIPRITCNYLTNRTIVLGQETNTGIETKFRMD